ncbi:MAG: NAD+ synthase, partial [Bacteroidales bacterium]|nr:NAD+ synthase [Bacteroidales bacterium]
MKIALAQINYHIGNFEENSRKIINSIRKGKLENVDLVVFSELAVSGYPPRDFLEFRDFVERCQDAVEKIADECHGIAAIVGSPSF